MQWVCRPCLRAKLRERSRKPIGVVPVSCDGAGERLRLFLDEHWDEASDRLADLIAGRPRDVDGRRTANAARGVSERRSNGQVPNVTRGAA